MLSAFIDTGALAKTVAAAFVAGVGITLIFSVALYGAARFAEMGREGRNPAALVYGTLAVVAGSGLRRGDRRRDNRHDREMRHVRNIAIIMALALVVVAAVPAGGQCRRGGPDRDLDRVPGGDRPRRLPDLPLAAADDHGAHRTATARILVGAIGLIVLMIAGADEMLETGLGALDLDRAPGGRGRRDLAPLGRVTDVLGAGANLARHA